MVKVNNNHMITNLSESGYFDYYNLPEEITEEEKLYINNYLYYYVKDYIIGHQDEEFDQNQNYIIIEFNNYNNQTYRFISNDVDDFIKLVHEKYLENKEELKEDDASDND